MFFVLISQGKLCLQTSNTKAHHASNPCKQRRRTDFFVDPGALK